MNNLGSPDRVNSKSPLAAKGPVTLRGTLATRDTAVPLPERFSAGGARLLVCLLLALALSCAGALSAGAQMQRHPFPPLAGKPNPMRAPGLLSGPRIPLGLHPASGFQSLLALPVEGGQRPLLLSLLRFYRTVVSSVNGSNSDLAPVHSLYAAQALVEFGSLMGMILVAERLIHEPGEIPFAPPFTENGRVFHYDPLIWNSFWLY